MASIVFISYAHDDNKLMRQLVRVLKPLQDAGQIVICYDEQIQGGVLWQPKLDDFISQADVVLLLVTDRFLASKACREETDAALARRQRGRCAVVPIIAEACIWQPVAYRGGRIKLGELNALPPGGKPIRGRGWASRGEAWAAVADGVRLAFCQPDRRMSPRTSLSSRLPMPWAPTLPWREFEIRLKTDLRRARRIIWISRTGSGWFNDLGTYFIILPPKRQTQFLFLDPHSIAFDFDTARYWKPRPVAALYAGTGAQRRQRSEELLNNFAASPLEFDLRVTDVLLSSAIIALFFDQTNVRNSTIYVEIPDRRAVKHGNSYLPVEPDRDGMHRHYLAMLRTLWNCGRAWRPPEGETPVLAS